MWSKEEAENWIFEKLEFIETIISAYFSLFFGLLLRPKKTLINLHEKETVSPFIFFFINLLLAGVIDSIGNISGFLKIILKTLVLTTKPTFDDAFYSILGLLIGTLLFVYLFRFVSGRVANSKLSFKLILKPLLYASFLFAPILILKEVMSALILGRIFSLMRSFMGGRYDFAFFIACSGVIYFVMLYWWLYIVYLGSVVSG